ncbi:vitamin K-dependent gamma-carboxylase [Fopius arisanus]|uniref:Vitamin K-dependent gamma-carboxylase n=1 Tax=Fopius arisanus TaxID=64838 RepID=A0A9R1T446_9HYME|nr:PREDICTED: vitamin K-dependent gamma-carboxylase [Fopius arisanus]
MENEKIESSATLAWTHQKIRIPSRESIDNKLESLWGFKLSDLTNYERFVELLYRPTDGASLGVARALFGLCMVIDVVEERGLSDIDLKWRNTHACHFPLIHGMNQPPLPYMILLYTVMWLGAFGIMLGLFFHLSCACFVLPYWYIFILDKSFWNNHSYLYGIIGILLWGTDANRYWALDTRLSKKPATVPLWNYFILKFQFFALYFLAGLKKSSREWLEGYSMMNLSEHWVFDPFKLLLTTAQTDFLIVHWFGFIFDLTVGFWLLFDTTRIPAMIFCAAFHLMNSRLFSIGMFPYVCLATMGLFCHVDWPRKIITSLTGRSCDTGEKKSEDTCPSETEESDESESQNKPVSGWIPRPIPPEEKITPKPRKKQKIVVGFLLLHVILQLFLPYSHFITRGYNNWVSGLYGYSWDMMVHNWDTILIVVKVHDNESNEDHFLDPQAWVQNEKWSKHPDMVIQYTQCVKTQLLTKKQEFLESRRKTESEWSRLSSNLSIYVDVRCSLNSRFQQRIFDPNIDMLMADWHPLKPASFLMPLLTQYNSYRQKMEEITQEVYTWSNYTDVLFVADYPSMKMENYFSLEFSNVTLTVLEGQVTYSEENWQSTVTVDKDNRVSVTPGKLHEITTVSAYPSCYMYTYTNQTKEQLAVNGITEPSRKRIGFPILKEIQYKVNAWWRALGHITNAFFYLVYDVPMVRRVPRETNYHEDNRR